MGRMEFAEVFECVNLYAAADADNTGPKNLSTDFDYSTLFANSFNVLIIDDEMLVVRMLQRVLKKYADNLYTASTPEDARQVLRNHTVSLVVCDFNLGADVPNGTALTAALRGEFPEIEHAVVFSGEDKQNIPNILAVDEVLHKSRDLERLCEIVRQLAQSKRIARQ